jgi:hypothetical protein
VMPRSKLIKTQPVYEVKKAYHAKSSVGTQKQCFRQQKTCKTCALLKDLVGVLKSWLQRPHLQVFAVVL